MTSTELLPVRPVGREAASLPAVLMAATFALGVVVPLAWSWHPSLWTDEAATISAARRSFPELLRMASTIDAVHVTYYALMHGWLALVPTNAFTLRLPSAVLAGLTALVVLVLGDRLGGRRLGLVGAVVLVVLPRSTWAGAEGRPFAASALLAAVLTLVAVQLARTDGTLRRQATAGLLLVYALLAGLAVLVNVYVALLLVAHGLTFLLWRHPWRLRLAWLAAASLGVLASLPVVWLALHQTGQLGGGRLGLGTWARNVLVNQWFLGETPTLGSRSGASLADGVGWKGASLALATLAWGLVAVGLLRARSAPVLRWALPWVVVPTLVIGLYSLLVNNLYSARYLTFAGAGVALLVAHGVVSLARPRVGHLLVVLLVVLAAPVYVSQRGVNAKSGADWSQLAEVVGRNKVAGEGVYFSPRYPIEGPVVLQTARNVSVAYPRAFDGLVDVTILRTAVAEGDLVGRSALLADARPRWEGLDALWVLRRHDYAYAAEDDSTLTAAGFRPVLTWSGPLDEVVEYRRGAA